jgi:hypothetical protein
MTVTNPAVDGLGQLAKSCHLRIAHRARSMVDGA